MTSYLQQIIEHVRERNEAMKAALGPNDTGRLIASRPDTPRGFAAAVSPSTDKTLIIGEIKRRSPSIGVIREDLDPGTIAHEYEEAGAVAVSVLTENQFFDGSVDDLQAAREATRIPILRKDFIIDPYQVPRSYGTGADAILVIVRAVPDDTTLHQILDAAENIHLDVLTEVYDEQDCERLLEIGKDSPNGLRVVGFNCRDLTTFQTDLTRPAKLVPYFPETTTLISLSGVKTRADIEAVRASSPRLTRFLIGESLLRAEYPGDALRALLDPKS